MHGEGSGDFERCRPASALSAGACSPRSCAGHCAPAAARCMDCQHARHADRGGERGEGALPHSTGGGWGQRGADVPRCLPMLWGAVRGAGLAIVLQGGRGGDWGCAGRGLS